MLVKPGLSLTPGVPYVQQPRWIQLEAHGKPYGQQETESTGWWRAESHWTSIEGLCHWWGPPGPRCPDNGICLSVVIFLRPWRISLRVWHWGGLRGYAAPEEGDEPEQPVAGAAGFQHSWGCSPLFSRWGLLERVAGAQDLHHPGQFHLHCRWHRFERSPWQGGASRGQNHCWFRHRWVDVRSRESEYVVHVYLYSYSDEILKRVYIFLDWIFSIQTWKLFFSF